ncbi:MAG: hypothetical protein R3E76_13880 [Planctomycetota bacterium]
MLRALLVIAAVLASAQCLARDLTAKEADAIYSEWASEESRTLEGWKVLQQYPTLATDVTHLAGLSNGEDETEEQEKVHPKARALLGLAYLYGEGGAPRDWRMASSLLSGLDQRDLEYLRLLWNFNFEYDEAGRFVVGGRYLADLASELVDPKAGELTPAYEFIAGISVLAEYKWRLSGPTGVSKIESAAKLGCLPAMVELARLLYCSQLLDRDANRAETLLKTAAAADFQPAWLELARFCHPDTGARPNLERCREALLRASTTGSVYATEMLGALPIKALADHGVGTLFDEYIKAWPSPEQSRWHRNNATSASPNPMLLRYPELAATLRKFTDPTPKEEIPELTVAMARCMLAECRLYGVGGAMPDVDEAMSLLKASYDAGLVAAALLYAERGFILAKDDRFRPDKQFNIDASRALLEALKAGFAPAVRLQAVALSEPRLYVFSDVLDADSLELFQTPKPTELMDSLARKNDPVALRWICTSDECRQGDAAQFEGWLLRGTATEVPEAMLSYAEWIHAGKAVGEPVATVEELLNKCRRYRATRDQADVLLKRRAASEAIKRAEALTVELIDVLERTGDYIEFLKANPNIAGDVQRAFEAGADAAELYALVLFNGHGMTMQLGTARSMLLALEDSSLGTYLFGRLVEFLDTSRISTALQCYQAAGKTGAGYAYYRMALVYRDGIGVEADEQQAFKGFKAGAEKGCVEAMVETAVAYHDGVGVEIDLSEAGVWIDKGVNAGSDRAVKLQELWKK